MSYEMNGQPPARSDEDIESVVDIIIPEFLPPTVGNYSSIRSAVAPFLERLRGERIPFYAHEVAMQVLMYAYKKRRNAANNDITFWD